MREGRIPASLLSTRASSRPSAARIARGGHPRPSCFATRYRGPSPQTPLDCLAFDLRRIVVPPDKDVVSDIQSGVVAGHRDSNGLEVRLRLRESGSRTCRRAVEGDAKIVVSEREIERSARRSVDNGLAGLRPRPLDMVREQTGLRRPPRVHRMCPGAGCANPERQCRDGCDDELRVPGHRRCIGVDDQQGKTPIAGRGTAPPA